MEAAPQPNTSNASRIGLAWTLSQEMWTINEDEIWTNVDAPTNWQTGNQRMRCGSLPVGLSCRSLSCRRVRAWPSPASRRRRASTCSTRRCSAGWRCTWWLKGNIFGQTRGTVCLHRNFVFNFWAGSNSGYLIGLGGWSGGPIIIWLFFLEAMKKANQCQCRHFQTFWFPSTAH